MTTDVEAVSGVLRSLAEARDGLFYQLWIELLRDEPKPLPEIGFRIYRSDGPPENASHTVVQVSAVRADGRCVTWCLALDSGNALHFAGSVDIDEPDGGSREVFLREAETASARDAPLLVESLATEVCAQRHWWTPLENQ